MGYFDSFPLLRQLICFSQPRINKIVKFALTLSAISELAELFLVAVHIIISRIITSITTTAVSNNTTIRPISPRVVVSPTLCRT